MGFVRFLENLRERKCLFVYLTGVLEQEYLSTQIIAISCRCNKSNCLPKNKKQNLVNLSTIVEFEMVLPKVPDVSVG